MAQTFCPSWAISGEIFEAICQLGSEPCLYRDVESSLNAKTLSKYSREYILSPSDSI